MVTRTPLLFLALAATTAAAQITPVRTYNGVGRPLAVQVQRPAGMVGDLKIALLKPVSAEKVAESATKEGRADLAALFPSLWTEKSTELRYAQLIVGGKPAGPALVLQPMLNPPMVKLAADGKTVEFAADEDGPMFNGYRAYPDRRIVMVTSMGELEFKLRPDAAPNTAWIMAGLVEGGLYTESIFHRIVGKRPDGTPFVLQGGDPTGTGSGGPGFAYALEKSTLPHDFGVLSIARTSDPNSNGCQFFICLSRAGTQHLDGKYSSFAELVRGADVVRRIAAVPVGENDRPKEPPVVLRAFLRPAPPYSK